MILINKLRRIGGSNVIIPPPIDNSLYPPLVQLTPVTVTAKSMPAYLGTYIEDSYGTLPGGKILKTKRITENAGETHHYSKTQPWNCDMSFCITGEGILAVLRDGRTFVQIRNIQPVGVNYQWSRTDPNVFWYLTDLILTKVTLSNGGTTVVRTTVRDFRDFGSISYAQLGPSEGQFYEDTLCVVNITVDSVQRVYVFNIVTSTIVYNRTRTEIGALLTTPFTGADTIDFVSITEWGGVIIDVDREVGNNEVAILSQNMLTKISQISAASHPDTGYGLDGITKIVSAASPISYTNADTGIQTRPWSNEELFTLNLGDMPVHTSFKAYKKRGYILYSSAKQVAGTNVNEIWALKTDGSRDCMRFGFRRTIPRDLAITKPEGYYVNEPHGVPSPDLTMVMWKGIFDDPVNNPNFISHSYVTYVELA